MKVFIGGCRFSSSLLVSVFTDSGGLSGEEIGTSTTGAAGSRGCFGEEVAIGTSAGGAVGSGCCFGEKVPTGRSGVEDDIVGVDADGSLDGFGGGRGGTLGGRTCRSAGSQVGEFSSVSSFTQSLG